MLGGLEIHPAIVHFPIALSAVGALSAVVYMLFRAEWVRWFAPWLLSLALLGAVAAYFSGESAKDRAEKIGVPESAMDQHEETGIVGLGVIGLACLLSWATHARRKGVLISATVAVIGAGILFWNGHLGGKLVFIHGAGRVKAPAGQATPQAPKHRREGSAHR